MKELLTENWLGYVVIEFDFLSHFIHLLMNYLSGCLNLPLSQRPSNYSYKLGLHPSEDQEYKVEKEFMALEPRVLAKPKQTISPFGRHPSCE